MIPLLVATLSILATNLWHCYYECIYFSRSPKATSNLATIYWQIGWPYYRGNTVCTTKQLFEDLPLGPGTLYMFLLRGGGTLTEDVALHIATNVGTVKVPLTVQKVPEGSP